MSDRLQALADAGVKEILVISQDTSAYGVDVKYRTGFWGGKPMKTKLFDLANALGELGIWIRMHYVYPYPSVDDLIPLMEPATMAPGFIGRDEVRARYEEKSGRDLSRIDYYVALGLWKLAIILEGVYARYAAGQYGKGSEEDEGLRTFARTVERLAEKADKAERRLD